MSEQRTEGRRRRVRSVRRREGVGGRRKWTVRELFGDAALAVAAFTVAISAWLNGGREAPGQLVLQCGALFSVLLLLAGFLVSRRLPGRLPLVVLPVMGLCGLALFQLLPIWRSPVLSMGHAVFAELAVELPATSASVGGSASEGLASRAVMPGRGYLALNQLLSLVLLGFVFFEATWSPLRAVLCCVPLVLSGVLMGVAGLSATVSVNEVGFGCFVNPNNASGWLLVCLSAAFFCAGFTFANAPPLIQPSLVKTTRRERLGYALGHLARRTGEMTAVQAGASLSCVLLLCAIVGTLSRAGITAGVLSVLVFFASRIRTNRWLMGVCGLVFLVLLSLGLLLLLDLDTSVVSELETLKDPVSATTIRLLHWSDSVRSVFDFPLLGSGYSGYRDGALPYARHFTNNWFERADNYYLELLVECGVLGFLLGAISVFLSLTQAVFLVFAKQELRSGIRRSCGDWAGSAVLCLLFSLGGQNFFDFSISLGGVAAGVVMLQSILERRWEEARRLSLDSERGSAGLEEESVGFWRRLTGRPWVVLGLWGLTLVGSCSLLRDCWYAAEAYPVMLELRDSAREPDPVKLIEDGDRLLAEVDRALRVRPHDEELQRYRVLFMKRLAEREIYLEALGERDLDPPQQRQLFNAVGFHSLAQRYLTADSAEDRRLFAEAAGRALQKYPWPQAAWKLLRELPLASGVAVDLIAADVLEPQEVDRKLLVNQVLFADPHSADRLAALGEYLILTGDQERGLQVWEHSLRVSERFRAGILVAAARIFGAGESLSLFAPSTFESAVLAAEQLSGGVLREAMLEDATRYWEAGGFRVTVPLCLLRAAHLRLLGRAGEAADFLQEQLLLLPGNLSLMLKRAEMLELAGRNGEAYDEWVRIRELDGELPEVEKSLARLSRLPPTSVPEDVRVREAELERSEKAQKREEEKAEKQAEERRARRREKAPGGI